MTTRIRGSYRLHAPYILIVVDESGDISPAVARKADQAMGGVKWGRIIQSGNPTVETGMLYEAVKRKAGWIVYEISADPDDPDRTPRVEADWAREQIELHGKEDPWVMIYILGKFPPGGVNKLLSVQDVEAAMSRQVPRDAYEFAQKRLGIDAARFGDDPWVIFPRQGRCAFTPVMMRGPRSQDVVSRVLQAKERWGSEVEFFDDTGGWAVGAIDGLVAVGHSPIPVNFSSQKTQDDRMYNVRAEIYWRMAEWIKSGGCLPHHPELIKELTAPTYGYRGGKILLEEKDQLKKRVGHSLDFADALALTFYHPEMAAARLGRSGMSGKSEWEYDPLSEKSGKEFDSEPFGGHR
jgi:hypothetical protein